MQEYGGFEIQFINDVNTLLVKDLIEETICEGENWIKIKVDESMKKIFTEEGSFINYNTFKVLFPKICKKIVIYQPKISFNGISSYSNLSIDYYAYCIVTYRQRKKELVIKDIAGENFDGYCPECGRKLFKPIEYAPDREYYCTDCNKKYSLNIDYKQSKIILQKVNLS